MFLQGKEVAGQSEGGLSGAFPVPQGAEQGGMSSA